MMINDVFDESLNGMEWTISFADYQWVLPSQIRADNILLEELYEVFQMLLSPSNEFLWDAVSPHEKSKLICAIFFDRILREGCIQYGGTYDLDGLFDGAELRAKYTLNNQNGAKILIKIKHEFSRKLINFCLKFEDKKLLNGSEIQFEFHHDNIASINAMRRLINLGVQICRKYI